MEEEEEEGFHRGGEEAASAGAISTRGQWPLAVDEYQERQKKRLNLVLVGLPVPQPGLGDQPVPNDLEHVQQLARQVNIPQEQDKVVKVYRHGRERAD